MKDFGLGIHRVARKQHVCFFCPLAIEVGDKYVLYNIKKDGHWLTYKAHLSCDSKSKQFILPPADCSPLVVRYKRRTLDWKIIQRDYKRAWVMFFNNYFSNMKEFFKDEKLLFKYLDNIFKPPVLYDFFNTRLLNLFIIPAKDPSYRDRELFSFEIHTTFGNVLMRSNNIYIYMETAEAAGLEHMFLILENSITN